MASIQGCSPKKEVGDEEMKLGDARLVKTGYNTRARAHNFVLPPKDNTNFLPRMLYIDIYIKSLNNF